MREPHFFLGIGLKNRSVLASGILGVTFSSLKKMFDAGAGIVTTKSIGPEKRKGHRGPVVHDWGEGLINAVGLSNPGIDHFVECFRRAEIDFPLIVSIFGEKIEDFSLIAQKLEQCRFSMLELNISCPNVFDEFGTPFSFSPELTGIITKKVRDQTTKPLIVKLSPNTPELIRVARAAQDSGADALCIINTVGPGMVIDTSTGSPVLGNLSGGISGDAILPLTVKNVFDVSAAVTVPVIGTGGITDVNGALQVLMAGASLYGIGSAVYFKGLSVFEEIARGVEKFLHENRIGGAEEVVGLAHRWKPSFFFRSQPSEKSRAGGHADHTHIPFQVCEVCQVQKSEDGRIKTLFFRNDFKTAPAPGQFFMLWKPGEDQKPYSVSFCDGDMVGFSVKNIGDFSDSLMNTRTGSPVGLLGPLGKGFDLAGHENYLLVGGGIGLAPLLFAAQELIKRGARVNMLVGGKDRASIAWIETLLQQRKTGEGIRMFFCTEDGSCGDPGLISGQLQRVIDEVSPDFALVCAPEACIVGCIEIFSRNAIPGEASIERMMKCGIGVCGSCSLDETGDRVCVEGPVFSFDYLRKVREFGKYRRDESGTVGEIG